MKIFVFTNVDWYLIERLKGVLERSSIAAWSYNNNKNNKHINNSNKNILNPNQVVYSSKALFTPHFFLRIFSKDGKSNLSSLLKIRQNKMWREKSFRRLHNLMGVKYVLIAIIDMLVVLIIVVTSCCYTTSF